MKKGFKKFSAFLLTAVMALAMNSTVLAAPGTTEELAGDGEEGVVGQFNGGVGVDTPEVKDDSINIKKEIVAFNPNGTTVNAPVVTYTYTVTPANVPANTTITDEDADHTSGAAVNAPVKAGLTEGLVVTGASAINGTVAAVNGATGTSTGASATLVFDNTSTWTTADTGDSNVYDIKLNFTNVGFTQPGVYRYQIAETISAASYAKIAMEDGDNNTLYLDVYVDGNLDIYGYVCMTANASVTPATDTKVNGFVNGTSIDNSDKYYTYDLVLSKDVVNDTYGESNIAYPFTVIFRNPEEYSSTFTITETAASGSTGISPAAASAPTWSGVAKVKDGADITYTGIPAGVDVDVYETNIASGVTYTVSTSVTGGTAVVDNNVVAGTTPASAVAQTTKAAYESTKATVDTTAIVATDAQDVAITNTLLLISPTGFVVRFAPYALVLFGGIFLIVLGVVLYKRTNKEEA